MVPACHISIKASDSFPPPHYPSLSLSICLCLLYVSVLHSPLLSLHPSLSRTRALSSPIWLALAGPLCLPYNCPPVPDWHADGGDLRAALILIVCRCLHWLSLELNHFRAFSFLFFNIDFCANNNTPIDCRDAQCHIFQNEVWVLAFYYSSIPVLIRILQGHNNLLKICFDYFPPTHMFFVFLKSVPQQVFLDETAVQTTIS